MIYKFAVLVKNAVFLVTLKARSNGSNMLVEHYPTLLGGVGRCFWSVLDAGVFKRIQHHPTMLDFSTGTKLWSIFDQANENVERCWMKSLNKVKLHPTSSNTVQHVWWCCSKVSNVLRPTMFDDVWPTCLIRLNGP